MEPISIVFSRASTKFPIFSWLIMLCQRTPYSHVAIKMVDSETGLIVFYQASHTMVNCMGESVFNSQETIIYQFDFQVDSSLKSQSKNFAIQRLGLPYGMLSILGLLLVQLASFIGIKISNPLKDEGKTYVCSEFVADLLRSVEGINLGMIPDDITPKDLYPIVKSLPQTLNVVK